LSHGGHTQAGILAQQGQQLLVSFIHNGTLLYQNGN
jgi:hypothetical protein